jgi:DNA repair protein RecO (recombination protein O)
MPLLATEAIVLHVFDYSESSRILRLATREAGMQSVLARGARRAKSRFGTALDLFAQGLAQLYVKDGRDLQTLSAFDLTRTRPGLGRDLGRFAGASAIAELVLRFAAVNEAHPSLFDALAVALDRIADAESPRASEAALAGAWRLVAELGFAPSLDACSLCHTPVTDAEPLPFSHVAGGIVCAACARLHPGGGRTLPPPARSCIAAWSAARRVGPLEPREARAHQRLLREFLQEHLADGRQLRAFDAWEHGAWSTP